MRAATRFEIVNVLPILFNAFRQNPWFRCIANPERKTTQFEKVLMFSLRYAHRRKGVLLSDDGKAVALCFKKSPGDKEHLSDKIERFWLAISAFKVWRLPAILRHQAYLNRQRPEHEAYLHFWFLGAAEGAASSGSTNALIKQIFAHADEQQLTIYAETTLERNCRIYERFGMECYHRYESDVFPVRVWMLKRTPKVSSK